MSLKEIRGRIHSVGSIMQITSAMKMVSASKLKKTRDVIYQIDKYIINMIKIWSVVIRITTFLNFLPFEKRPILIIIIGSNRGLCGGFNVSIFKQIVNNYCKYSTHLITIGKKIKDLLSNRFHIYKDYSNLLDNICYNKISKFCERLIYDFLKGNFHSVHLIYNSFKKNTSLQVVISEKIFPIKKPPFYRKESNFLFEPSKKYIIHEIITKNIKTHLCKAILASYITEQGSRMKAMHQSTDNASKLKKKLLFTYNKARQTAITKEILEIMSGFSIYV